MRHLRITHYNYSTKCCLPGRLITSCALGRYPDSAFLNCYDKCGLCNSGLKEVQRFQRFLPLPCLTNLDNHFVVLTFYGP